MNTMDLKYWIPFFPYGLLIMLCGLINGLFCLNSGYYLGGILFLAGFVIMGLTYGYSYYYPWPSSLSSPTEKMKEPDHTFLEDIMDENVFKSVDVKFDLAEIGGGNTFLQIKIPSSFIDQFKKYNRTLNSPSILGKKICEWGDCENGMCVQDILCFSKAEIKSTIEHVTNEVYAAIEWLPKEYGGHFICIREWVNFVWK